ncbi:MAG: protein-L-isoaspartate(D-aspartate) O-methyltransferase [Bacteroidales bacterium]|nr:protein-L-isoaspartate(D-aspartate) O-methyltransferase [Bacteroidales bacterium]MCF8387354.1 protein-L-isoaspartate(D-aspartate) O-methyltransferase [Bacteroidales bacterium]MCF8396853.1 protein-L-isoaspartate(D-aspartate) O-methyltransferase [Bacteroidales bacterium]
MTDTYKHRGLRTKLAREVESKGIKDKRILEAIRKIPRHLFMDSGFLEFAYQDKPFPIGSGQTISQPYTVAFQTELLEVEKGNKVLEVGTGSGYQACVLMELRATVYSIERQKKLYQKVQKFLPSIGYNVKVFYGDGYKGLPAFAPFDRILVTAGAEEIPHQLLEQLRPGGIMVVPVGGQGTQNMKKIMKTEDGKITEEDHGYFRFVPLLGNTADE